MEKIRLDTIQKLLDLVDERITMYKNEAPWQWSSTRIASLVRVASWSNGNLILDAKRCPWSIARFQRSFIDLKDLVPGQPSNAQYQYDDDEQQTLDAVQEIIDNIPSPLLECHKKHFSVAN
jgi:hypothetical protein